MHAKIGGPKQTNEQTNKQTTTTTGSNTNKQQQQKQQWAFYEHFLWARHDHNKIAPCGMIKVKKQNQKNLWYNSPEFYSQARAIPKTNKKYNNNKTILNKDDC